MPTKKRISLVSLFFLFPVIPLILRLLDLQVRDHANLSIKANKEFSRTLWEISPRADITDRNGDILAQSLPVWRLFADKKMIQNPNFVAQKLARLLKMSPLEISRRYQSRKRFPVLADSLSYDQAEAIEKLKIGGLGLSLRERRFYPNGSLASNVLGKASDGQGLSGVELSWNKRLTGKPRRLRVIRDGSGKMIYLNADNSGFTPKPLPLTIDRDIQYIAEEALDSAAKTLSIKSGTVLIEDPQTGQILAMASYPRTPLKNPAIQDTYEPGSVMKIVTATAALENKVVSTAEQIFCENGSFAITPRVTIHDDEPSQYLTLSGILERSSNIGISKVVLRVGKPAFYRMLRAYGFLNKTGIRLPGEAAGDWKTFNKRGEISLTSASYGYGVAVTPLQVLAAYNTVAAGGILRQPLISIEESPDKIRKVASSSTIETLTQFLENVVEKGTGALAQIPGYSVAGKTGTSHEINPKTKKYSRTKYNASFVGFLPANHPLWSILVVLNGPKKYYYGGQASAPVFSEIARRLIALKGLPPEPSSTIQNANLSKNIVPAASFR